MKDSDYPYIENFGACKSDNIKYVAKITKINAVSDNIDPILLKISDS